MKLRLTCAPLGAAESAPLLDFLNNSTTVADIDTKIGVPYTTSIWHPMIKFCWNIGRNVFEKLTFLKVWSLQAKFDQNQLNVKKFAKNRGLKQTAQKDQHRCKTRSPKCLSQNFKILSFYPQNFEKPKLFKKKLHKIQNFQKFEKTEYIS